MSHFVYPTPFNRPLLEDNAHSQPVTVRALIRNRDFGCLIGKDGSRHRSLERDFRVKVYFLEPDGIIHDRLVSIAGMAHNVARAWREVLQRMFERLELKYSERLGVKVLVPDCLAKHLVTPFDQLDDDDDDCNHRGEKEKEHMREDEQKNERQINGGTDYYQGRELGQGDGFASCKCELEEITLDSGATLVLDDELLSGSTERCLQVLIESLDDEALERFEIAMELIAECFIAHRHLAMSPMNTYYSPRMRQRRRESGSRSSLSSISPPPPPVSEDEQGGGPSVGSVSSSSSGHNGSSVQPTNWIAFSQQASTDNSYIDGHSHRPNPNVTYDTPSWTFPPLRRSHPYCLKLLLSNEEAGMLLANRGGSLFLLREIERASTSVVNISPLPPYDKSIRGLRLCEVSHIPSSSDWNRFSDIYKCPRVARVSATMPAALVEGCMRIAISISTHGLVPIRQLRNGDVSVFIIIPTDNLAPIFGQNGHRMQALRAKTNTLISQADKVLPESEEWVMKVVGPIEGVEEVIRCLLFTMTEMEPRRGNQALREYDPLILGQVAERSRRATGVEF